MPKFLQLETLRLLLRPWQERDRDPFAAMNADPVVMTFFAAPMTREASEKAIDCYQADFAQQGFCFLAAELRSTGVFVGTIGMQIMRHVVPNLPQPAVEIGWRLAQQFHGQGLATEGSRAVVDFAFHQLKLPQVVAITVPANTSSRHVMEKLGMTHRPDLSFDHPSVPPGHLFRRHVLYSLSNPVFQEAPCSQCS